jgi:hypothetical protein
MERTNMDNAIGLNPTGRKFPSYTTAQLKAFVAETDAECAARYVPPMSPEKRAAMELEIARRESGESRTLHQILNEAAKS